MKKFNTGDKVVFINDFKLLDRGIRPQLGEIYCVLRNNGKSVITNEIPNFGFYSKRFMLLSEWENMGAVQKLLFYFHEEIEFE